MKATQDYNAPSKTGEDLYGDICNNVNDEDRILREIKEVLDYQDEKEYDGIISFLTKLTSGNDTSLNLKSSIIIYRNTSFSILEIRLWLINWV